MVMKKTTRAAEPAISYGQATIGARRLGVAETKAKLSEVLRSLERGPVIIHARGRDLGALVDVETFQRLAAHDAGPDRPGGSAFLDAVEALRRRHRGVASFDPKPAVIRPQDPFRARRRG
jgi:prevent-host-death family protein